MECSIYKLRELQGERNLPPCVCQYFHGRLEGNFSSRLRYLDNIFRVCTDPKEEFIQFIIIIIIIIIHAWSFHKVKIYIFKGGDIAGTRGYSWSFLHSIKNELQRSFGERQTNNRVEQNNNIVSLVSSSCLALLKVNSMATNDFETLQDTVQSLSEFKIISAFMRSKNLKDLLVHACLSPQHKHTHNAHTDSNEHRIWCTWLSVEFMEHCTYDRPKTNCYNIWNCTSTTLIVQVKEKSCKCISRLMV